MRRGHDEYPSAPADRPREGRSSAVFPTRSRPFVVAVVRPISGEDLGQAAGAPASAPVTGLSRLPVSRFDEASTRHRQSPSADETRQRGLPPSEPATRLNWPLPPWQEPPLLPRSDAA